jgi:metal-responsive CopG/Arc/MetJ family transcriptional regulator
MKKKKLTKSISLTIKEDILKMINELSEKEGISKSFVVNKLLEKELQKYINNEKNLFNI